MSHNHLFLFTMLSSGESECRIPTVLNMLALHLIILNTKGCYCDTARAVSYHCSWMYWYTL